MAQFAYYLLMTVSVVLCLPSFVLFMECLVAIPSRKRSSIILAQPRPTIAVVVPAHNESAGIAQTLNSIRAQLVQQDQLIVVADNCSDDTASIAEPLCTTVLIRNDAIHRGKGFAIRFALEALKVRAPEIVVFVDADCTLGPSCLDSLAQAITETNGPVQGDNQSLPHSNSMSGALISSFAVCVKNSIRPLGARRLGFPNWLSGTGMGMPWALTESMQVDQGNIVEDMQLGIDLAISGYPARYCEDARVVSYLPLERRAIQTQRTRWEHGHLATLVSQVPRLLWQAIRTRNPALVALAMDLAIPPLALLTLGIASSVLAATIYGCLTGSWLPCIVGTISGMLLFTSIVLAWVKQGYQILPFSKLVHIPKYVLSKVQLYASFLIRRQTAWIRTDRDEVAINASAERSILSK